MFEPYNPLLHTQFNWGKWTIVNLEARGPGNEWSIFAPLKTLKCQFSCFRVTRSCSSNELLVKRKIVSIEDDEREQNCAFAQKVAWGHFRERERERERAKEHPCHVCIRKGKTQSQYFYFWFCEWIASPNSGSNFNLSHSTCASVFNDPPSMWSDTRAQFHIFYFYDFILNHHHQQYQ